MPGVKSTSYKLRKVYPRVSIPLDALVWGRLRDVYVVSLSRIVKSENARIEYKSRNDTISATNSGTETVSYIFAGRR